MRVRADFFFYPPAFDYRLKLHRTHINKHEHKKKSGSRRNNVCVTKEFHICGECVYYVCVYSRAFGLPLRFLLAIVKMIRAQQLAK